MKNSVFNPKVDVMEWLHKASVRALKTVAETFIATIGTSAVMGDVDWAYVGSASLLAGILSLAFSIKGIPEVQAKE